jgi:hypothetical protein
VEHGRDGHPGSIPATEPGCSIFQISQIAVMYREAVPN